MQDLDTSTFCPVAHDTAAHLRAEASIYASGDAFDSLAHEVAQDADLLSEFCDDNTALLFHVCQAALSLKSQTGRLCDIVDALKDHAEPQLTAELERRSDAADADEAEARA